MTNHRGVFLDKALATTPPFELEKIKKNAALQPDQIWHNDSCPCEFRKFVRASIVIGHEDVSVETPPFPHEFGSKHIIGEKDGTLYRRIHRLRYMELGDGGEVFCDEVVPLGEAVPAGKQFMRPGRAPFVKMVKRCPNHSEVPDLLTHHFYRNNICRCSWHRYGYKPAGEENTRWVALGKIWLCPKHEADIAGRSLLELPAVVDADAKAHNAEAREKDRAARLDRLYNDPDVRLCDLPTLTLAELKEFLRQA